jgi:hypothetical protein
MNIAELTNAVVTRLKADSGSGGIWNTTGGQSCHPDAGGGGIWVEDGDPAALAFPMIVLAFQDTEQPAMNSEGALAVVQVNIFERKERGLSKASVLIERVYGDAMTHGDRVPVFGLHRHVLSIDASSVMGWTGGMMQRARGFTAHDRDVWHFIEEYTIHTTSTGV